MLPEADEGASNLCTATDPSFGTDIPKFRGVETPLAVRYLGNDSKNPIHQGRPALHLGPHLDPFPDDWRQEILQFLPKRLCLGWAHTTGEAADHLSHRTAILPCQGYAIALGHSLNREPKSIHKAPAVIQGCIGLVLPM